MKVKVRPHYRVIPKQKVHVDGYTREVNPYSKLKKKSRK